MTRCGLVEHQSQNHRVDTCISAWPAATTLPEAPAAAALPSVSGQRPKRVRLPHLKSEDACSFQLNFPSVTARFPVEEGAVGTHLSALEVRT